MIRSASTLGAAGLVVFALAAFAPHFAPAPPADAGFAGTVAVKVLEEGESEWRELGAAPVAAGSALGCDINFRGSNSGNRRILVAWRDSQARIPSGWWARISRNIGTVVRANGGLLRSTWEVNTACSKRRRYRFKLIYESNNDGYFNTSDRNYTLYRPSADGWYSGGTTTINLGDLYAPFK